MKTSASLAYLSAVSLALSLPTFGAPGIVDTTQGSTRTDQLAQSQTEQPRLPAEKQAAPSATSSTAKGSGATSSDSSSTATKKIAPPRDHADAGRTGQTNSKKHPPTSVMDSATPEASKGEAGTAGKTPATKAMDRAMPNQKSPEPDVPK